MKSRKRTMACSGIGPGIRRFSRDGMRESLTLSPFRGSEQGVQN